jgi:hypothetical protein
MANEFSNNAKTKIIAQEIVNEMPYLKKAKSYIPQEQMVGKKYGNTYTVYIPDPGKARIAKASDGRNGLSAQVDEIKEVRYPIACEAGMSDVMLDEWEKFGDIESFTDEIALPHARNLAQTIEKYAVEKTVFDASQAVVGKATLSTIAEANGKLKKAGNAGSKVTYIDGVIGNKIAANAAGQIKNDAIVNDLYKDAAIGTLASITVVECNYMPKVVGSSAASFTVSVTTGDKGFDPIVSGTLVGAAGTPFKATGLKLVDKNGIQTNEDYVVIPKADGSIPELRVEFEGMNNGNANAWVPTGTSSLTFTTMLEDGKTYDVVQSRTTDAIAYDSYKFGNVPSCDMETQKKEALTLQTYKWGNGETLTTLVRLVAPFAVGLPEARSSVLSYLEEE